MSNPCDPDWLSWGCVVYQLKRLGGEPIVPPEISGQITPDIETQINTRLNERLVDVPASSLADRVLIVEEVLRESRLFEAALPFSRAIPRLIELDNPRRVDILSVALQNEGRSLDALNRTLEANRVFALQRHVASLK